jgi:hypothetical protein
VTYHEWIGSDYRWGRTESGNRALAHTPEGNKDFLHAMMQDEWIGTRGTVIGQKGKINVVDF